MKQRTSLSPSGPGVTYISRKRLQSTVRIVWDGSTWRNDLFFIDEGSDENLTKTNGKQLEPGSRHTPGSRREARGC